MQRKTTLGQRKDNGLLLLIVLLASLLFLYAASFRNGHAWNDDFPQYIAQARSIVDGSITETLDASLYRHAHSKAGAMGPVLHPWGFPLLLSGVYSLTGLDLLALKAFTSLFFLLSLGVIFFLFRGRISTTQNLLILLLLGINPVFFSARDDVLADFPFMFFTLLALLLIQRSLIDSLPLAGAPWDRALIGVGVFLSYETSTIGIVLLPTLLLVQVIQRARSPWRQGVPSLRSLSCLIPYAAFIFLVLALNALLPSRIGFIGKLAEMNVESIIRNIELCGAIPADFFTAAMSPFCAALGKLLFLISLPALCLGLFKAVREQYLFIVFSTLFLVLLILWPGIQGQRHAFPLLPFFLFFVFHGLGEAASLYPPFTGKRAGHLPAWGFGITTAALFCITVAGQTYHVLTHPGVELDGPFSRESAALFRRIADNTRKGDVVVFHDPCAMWLFTGRNAIELERIEDIMVSQAGFIACRKNDSMDLLLRKKRGVACMVYANGSSALYERMRPGPISLAPPPEALVRKALLSAPTGTGEHGSSKKHGSHRKKKKIRKKKPPEKHFSIFDYLPKGW